MYKKISESGSERNFETKNSLLILSRKISTGHGSPELDYLKFSGLGERPNTMDRVLEDFFTTMDRPPVSENEF